jgi:hypothetical protein
MSKNQWLNITKFEKRIVANASNEIHEKTVIGKSVKLDRLLQWSLLTFHSFGWDM